jgi:hypothetical protein
MPKKSLMEKFKAFVEASPSESNEPMTKGEIATAMARKRRKGAATKRPAKAASKMKAKKAVKKKSAKEKNAERKSKS